MIWPGELSSREISQGERAIPADLAAMSQHVTKYALNPPNPDYWGFKENKSFSPGNRVCPRCPGGQRRGLRIQRPEARIFPGRPRNPPVDQRISTIYTQCRPRPPLSPIAPFLPSNTTRILTSTSQRERTSPINMRISEMILGVFSALHVHFGRIPFCLSTATFILSC